MRVYLFTPLLRPLNLVDSKGLFLRAILSRACPHPDLCCHCLRHGFLYLCFRLYFHQESPPQPPRRKPCTPTHPLPMAWFVLFHPYSTPTPSRPTNRPPPRPPTAVPSSTPAGTHLPVKQCPVTPLPQDAHTGLGDSVVPHKPGQVYRCRGLLNIYNVYSFTFIFLSIDASNSKFLRHFFKL